MLNTKSFTVPPPTLKPPLYLHRLSSSISSKQPFHFTIKILGLFDDFKAVAYFFSSEAMTRVLKSPLPFGSRRSERLAASGNPLSASLAHPPIQWLRSLLSWQQFRATLSNYKYTISIKKGITCAGDNEGWQSSRKIQFISQNHGGASPGSTSKVWQDKQ